MNHINDEMKTHTEPAEPEYTLQQGVQKTIDPREKEVADFLEKLTFLQRINLVLLTLTFAMLILHTLVDIFFNL